MGCECNLRSKILFCTSGLLGFVGVVLVIVVFTSGGEAAKVDYVSDNKKSFRLNVPSDATDHCGFVLYVAKTADCSTVRKDTTVTRPDGQPEALWIDSCGDMQEDHARDHAPPLQKMTWFGVKPSGKLMKGDWSVVSSAPLWAMDVCGEIAEAVGAFAAMLGVFVLAIIVWLVSCILCCVGCCCLGPEQAQVAVIGQPQLVQAGQPTVVQIGVSGKE